MHAAIGRTLGLVLALAVVAFIGAPSTAPTVSVVTPPMTAEVAPVPVGPTLVFASFNVCKTDCAPPAPSWDVRRERVARTIIESGVDVIGLQEVTHQPATNAKTQYQDLQNLVAPSGFVAPAYTPESDTCRWTAANPHPCTHTTGLLYRARSVSQVATPNGTPSAGTVPMSMIAAGLTPDAAPRKVVWAYLQGRNGTGPFLALSMHTSTLKDPGNEASRLAIGRSLDAWVAALNDAHGMTGVPVVLMADLNSYAKRQPDGVQALLVNSGWSDAAAAPTRRNTEYSTINYNPLLPLGEQGFPVTPYRFKTARGKSAPDATRIDYVLFRGDALTPLDYEVVIRLRADGTFDPAYQGSDHQMVRTTLSFAPRNVP